MSDCDSPNCTVSFLRRLDSQRPGGLSSIAETGALASRPISCLEQRESPPSASAEQVWEADMLEFIDEEIMPRLNDLEDLIIFLENQFAAVNKKNLGYRPRFTICIDRLGAEPYLPELRSVREQLWALKEELEGDE